MGKKAFSAIVALILLVQFPAFCQSWIDSIFVSQVEDGSNLVLICYKAHSHSDSIISVAPQGRTPIDTMLWTMPIVTILDTISAFSGSPNSGWRVFASPSGTNHCFLWDMRTDLGAVEECGFKVRFAAFDSIRNEFDLMDSFSVHDTLRPTVKAFGLTYRHGHLWVLYHDDITHQCWVKSYRMPHMIEIDSFFVGTVAVGPSDMSFAGDRLFWIEDTRLLLNEFDFTTGTSRVVRGDWWGLPRTSTNLAGVAFDGEKLWVCFCRGTFVALDTATFSLIDTMFFPSFDSLVPATCADGLAWGLGLLWCFSNDNIIYGIDTETKTIVHRIPTGEVVIATGAEGATWDGVNIWVIDYGRGYCYRVGLFRQIRYFYSQLFCLDNIPPRIEWVFPSCPNLSDSMFVDSLTRIRWTARDTNLAGGRTIVSVRNDTIANQPSTIFDTTWVPYPWHYWTGNMNLFITDKYGNLSRSTSCEFRIVRSTSGVDEISNLPNEFSLFVHPNPFNSAVRIMIDGQGEFPLLPAQIEIFDINGRRIEGVNGLTRGEVFVWRPDEKLGSGIYFVRAKMGNDEEIQTKILLVR